MEIFKKSKNLHSIQQTAKQHRTRNFLFAIAGFHVFVGLWVISLYRQQTPEGNYNKNIKDTKNLIAYIHFPLSESGYEDLRDSNISLLNAKTGHQTKLTDDKFEDTSPSWSPDGSRLVFVSYRSRSKMARHDSYNPSHLFIYDFRNSKETALEENINLEVDAYAKRLKAEGHDIERDSRYLPFTNRPHWFEANRIGFWRKLYFGKSRGSGELCSTDTLGQDLKIHRKIFSERKWHVMEGAWMSQDTIIVQIRKPSVYLGESQNLAYFLTKENEYFLFVEMEKDSYAQQPRLSRDKQYIVYTEYDPQLEIHKLVLLKLTTGEKKYLISDASEGVLSPNGKKIAFIKKVGGDADIYIMNSDGTDIEQKTFDGGVKYSLAWSPKSDY